MITHLLAITFLALAYGAIWHKQPARRPDHQGGDYPFLLGSLVNRALEWLLLIPHVSSAAKKKEPVPISHNSALAKGQTQSLRQAGTTT